MAIGKKSWKVRGFLLLGVLLSGAAGWLCLSPPAFAADLKKEESDCVQRFTEEFRGMKVEGKSLAEIDPPALCPANHNGGTVAGRNYVDSRGRPKLDGREAPSLEGACELTYQAVKDAYASVLEAREHNCGATYRKLEQFSACMKNSSGDDCEKKFAEITGAYQEGEQAMIRSARKAQAFVAKFPPMNEKARKNYQRDLDQLQRMTTTELSLPKAGAVLATDGGVATLSEYLEKLRTPAGAQANANGERRPAAAAAGTTGPLLAEQVAAKKTGEEFVTRINKFLDKDRRAFAEQLTRFRDGSTPADKSSLSNLQNVAGAAPLAQSMLPSSPGTTASATPAAVSGASSSLPALAALGAAGAALGGSSSASRSDPSFSAAAAPAPASAPGSGAEAPPAALASPSPVTAALPSGANAPAATETQPPPGVVTENPTVAATAATSGASMQDLKVGDRSPASSSGGVVATADDSLGPFGGELKAPSGAGRRAPKPSENNEITNLLGQMKDLFKIDENLGMDGSATGGAFAAMPTTGESVSEPFYEGSEAPYEETASTFAEESGEAQSDLPTGDSNVTLFERVQLCHRKCAAQGCVAFLPWGGAR